MQKIRKKKMNRKKDRYFNNIVNHYETDFWINFLGDLHSEQNEFINYESEQESCYDHIQENFQDDQNKFLYPYI
jgi:hypothetical protein